eukprot:SAG22_NODE_6116_length_896_cov_1.590966_1_plen_57_part_00
MEELVKCENVFVKLGGLTQPHAGHGFNLRPKPPTSAELAAVRSFVCCLPGTACGTS